MTPPELATAAGRILYWQKQQALSEISGKLNGNGYRNTAGIRQLVRYLSTDATLHDADELAFADLVEDLLTAVKPSPGAGKDPLVDSLSSALTWPSLGQG